MFLVYESTAHAYIDPGTGTFLWQIVLSSIAGALFFFRQIRVGLSRILRIGTRANSGDKSSR